MGKKSNADGKMLKELGAKIQKIRKSRNISQEAFADMISVHRTYVGMVERGERNPTVGTLQSIAEALKVGSKELLPF